ncbi:M20/M25/M40 family metallo-hydrolase [Pedobacter metabolipauper]|uniref:Acetylornithine deacetylase n=1 Tax=Pedobacter metabolipauper TaxID=425513 RepID=A0A4R6SZR8_9SPHI|nr:M20/M25/M40 family metallo-hydrolase [Pedobacter metabolipauper]TDQ11259.1 acetylornithine deacetylase [Pedobacter metabolipauper]
MKKLYEQAVVLLGKLIKIRSFSGEENLAADLVESFLNENGVVTIRKFNNIWCYNKHFDPVKPIILLNSHLDTVKPNSQYTNDPFNPIIKDGKLYGLGSNDTGGSLVSLISAFLYFYERKDLPYNLCLAATAEEENSGQKGIKCILDDLMAISFAIVGEPTNMQMAIAEKGSMVLDCVSTGRSGHAAREEGDNAIYKAIRDIHWFSTYVFPIEENQPNPVKMTVTQISAGLQHNIVPGECSFTVDIRFDHSYNVKEIVNTIKNHTFCDTTLRPNILTPSSIDLVHPMVKAGIAIGRKTYMSPTSSDQGWLEMPSIKMGPGESARSHTADEFIYLAEISDGITIYTDLLESIIPHLESVENVENVERVKSDENVGNTKSIESVERIENIERIERLECVNVDHKLALNTHEAQHNHL